MMPDLASVALVVSILGGGGLITWWQASKPSRQRAEAVADAILGQQEVRDRAGNVIRAGQPGLVHRVSTVEEAVKMMAATQADQLDLRAIVNRHDHRIGVLEAAALERAATKLETSSLLDAVARKDESVIDVESDE